MARQLFIDDKINEELCLKVLESKTLEPKAFWGKTFGALESHVKNFLMESVAPNFLDKIYFMGSFSRGVAGVQSDLDLLCLSEDSKEIEEINESLRTVFRNYSLKRVDSLKQFVEVSDAKGLLSGWCLTPVFGGEDVKSELRDLILKNRIEEIGAFLQTENQVRYKRYGERPGRVNFNIKYSPGGFLDLMQVGWRASISGNKTDELDEEALFLYKVRSLIHLTTESNKLQLTKVKNYAEAFGFYDEQDFFKKFYSTVLFISTALDRYKKIEGVYSLKAALFDVANAEELSHAEAELLKVRGVVLAPSYHVWTVDQHILTCIFEVKKFIKEYEEELSLTETEKTVLQWAAYFHDLKKGEEESHSILGAKAAQEFGKRHGWDPNRTELVSWLVREHLTLVKYSFKMDPFHPDFVKSLALRGCEGRRAVLLFVLSCADIVATNPSTWSDWKRGMLKKGLEQILGVRDTVKEELLSSLAKSSQKGLGVLEGLSVKEICMVPYPILLEDLKSLDGEGFSFFEFEGKYWIRSYFEADDFGFAEKFIESLQLVGAYIHHAVFKSLTSTGEVYNWVCVESGVSLKAFQTRFLMSFKSYESKKRVKIKDAIGFIRIRRTFFKKNYAVVSFKGKDRAGALVEAIRTLKKSHLNIEWGHAVTWGEEIEDVFGVSFEENVDWSFLTEK
ncbi:MAG: HD domain-containing protein [Bdellovibrionales bacterium]